MSDSDSATEVGVFAAVEEQLAASDGIVDV
jgi:hypothetical protein